MYAAGVASIGLSVGAWLASKQMEAAGLDRADRWGLFVGEWAPTFFALGVALRMEETHCPERADAERQRHIHGRRARRDARRTEQRDREEWMPSPAGV